MKTLTVFCGSMSSAKTTSALHMARRYQRLGEVVKLIRPEISIRSHEKPGLLVTKNGETFPALDAKSALEVIDLCKDATAVWIDEVFLFKDEELLFGIIQELRKTKEIIISAIGADCFLQPFRQTMPKLLAVADDVVFCKADCLGCGAFNKATRHVIFIDNVNPGESHVGDSESYAPTCPSCWTNLMTFPASQRKSKLLK